jgi:hypothetical protein
MLLFTTTTPTLPPHTQEHNKLTLHNTTKQKNVGPPAAYHAQLLPLLIQVLARLLLQGKGRQARGAYKHNAHAAVPAPPPISHAACCARVQRPRLLTTTAQLSLR